MFRRSYEQSTHHVSPIVVRSDGHLFTLQQNIPRGNRASYWLASPRDIKRSFAAYLHPFTVPDRLYPL